MTGLPPEGLFIDPTTINTQAKQAQEDVVAVQRQALGGAAVVELTIVSGTVVATQGWHAIDTEGDGAADDLENILQSHLPDGSFLMIGCVTGARVVTVKHAAPGAGRMLLMGDADFVLDDPQKWLWLRRVGADWQEVSRGYAADTSEFRNYLGLEKVAMTDVKQTFTKQQTPSGGVLTFATTQTWNCDVVQVARLTLTANVTTSESATNQVADTCYVLTIDVGAGPYDIAAWDATYIGIEELVLPEAANKNIVMTFLSDGTNMILMGMSGERG